MTEPTAIGGLMPTVALGMASQAAMPGAPRAAHDPERTGATRTPLPGYVRRAVLARDGYTCRWDGARRVLLEIDHVVPWSAGGADHPVNLRTLCGPCNQDRSNRVSGWDVREVAIAWDCRRCKPLADPDAAPVAAFCLTCRTVRVASDGRMLVGGAIPTVGIPPALPLGASS